MTNFNFTINLYGKHTTSVLNEIWAKFNMISELCKIEDENLQKVLAEGFEINFNFVDEKEESLIPPSDTTTKIEDLNFSIRTNNCLRRAGYQTINSVVNDIDRREDLFKIRNLGRKGADEVMLRLFLYTYENLKPEKRRAYLEKVKEMN